MSSIGIIANPASGKDIRRLVSHATIIDNNEKVNIVERIILGTQKFGVDKIYIMPDSFRMGHKVQKKLKLSEELTANIEVLDIKISGTPLDTEAAAKMMEEMGLGCVVVLGGDGTNRLVAKHLKSVPMIGVSTGTNNAYPEMLEGTVVGMAAAAVASGAFELDQMSTKDKIIEIYKDGVLVDIALMDVVITDDRVVGSKAVWDLNKVKRIIVSKCHPASIGFSAIVGVNQRISAEDDFGASMTINEGSNHFVAPVAAGTVAEITSDDLEIISLDQTLECSNSFKGMVAVDGEREVKFNTEERMSVRITRNGPVHVDVRRALEVAQEGGFFKKV